MAQDPRSFIVAGCDKGTTIQKARDARKRSFFSAVGKVGSIEALKDVGAGRIGQGMRVLASVSNSIRTGRSVVPGREGTELFNTTLGRILNTAADAVDNGARAVIDTVGLGGVFDTVNSINPNVANTAYGQAKDIYSKVKSGRFEITDIPGYLQDFQNVEALARGIFTKSPSQTSISICGASPYATDLIRVAHGPKHKFMYVVDIQISGEFQEEFRTYANENDTRQRDVDVSTMTAFLVKQTTRPSVEINYDEVNMYNFRTHVPRRATYKPMSMTLYDDNTGFVTQFYESYLKIISPISNQGDYTKNAMPPQLLEERSFAVPTVTRDENTSVASRQSTSATIGAMSLSDINIIDSITLFHIHDHGQLVTAYMFYNPKIVSFNADDLTMVETGNGNELGIDFVYDAMNIVPNIPMDQMQPRIEQTTATAGALYNIRNISRQDQNTP